MLICGDITDYVYLCAKFLIIMDNTKCLNRLRVVWADKQITNKWVAGEMGVNEMTLKRGLRYCHRESAVYKHPGNAYGYAPVVQKQLFLFLPQI